MKYYVDYGKKKPQNTNKKKIVRSVRRVDTRGLTCRQRQLVGLKINKKQKQIYIRRRRGSFLPAGPNEIAISRGDPTERRVSCLL